MKQEDKSSLKNTLYAQMHKQYLENDSSKTSTIHYYIGAIAFIFSAYGYVYSYPYLHPCVCLDASYSPLIIGITIFSYLILSLLAILAVNIGYCSRKEHNRIYQIFDKAGSSFFTRKNKTKIRLSNFLPDYYGILFVWGFTLFRYGLISKRKKPKYSSNLGFNPLEFRLQTLCSLFVIIMTLR